MPIIGAGSGRRRDAIASSTDRHPSSRLVMSYPQTHETQQNAEGLQPASREREGSRVAERNRSDDERAQEEQPSDGQGNAHSDPAAGLKNKVRSHPVIAIAAIVLVVAGLAGAGIWWLHARHFETTDDAFIDARQFSIAPKVQGYIVDVPVTDNQHVGKGAILLRIDDRDYQVAAEQAEAEVAAAQASIANIDAQISAQMAQVEQAESNVREAEAARNFSAEDAARYQKLAALGTGSVQKAQQTASQLQQQDATVARAKAGVNAAQKQVSSLQAQRNSAVADRLRAEAQRDQATLNLGYTTIVAAQSGHVVHLSAAKGGYVEAGQSVMMFVPDEIWVTANFKETQITDMRPGQPVDIEIDAYPKTDFHGHVVSLQTGSGTAFSLLPAENATGNFVKVVQRVPVKIAIDNLPPDLVLGPGLSVVPSVRVR